MITDVTEVDGPAGRAAIVRLAGNLTLDTAPRARLGLLKAIAAPPGTRQVATAPNVARLVKAGKTLADSVQAGQAS